MYPEKLTIAVTQEDIDWGVRQSTKACPIARVFARHFPGDYISVEGEVAYVGEVAYYLPWVAGTFIEDFDDDEPVDPFQFTAERTED